jgi:UDP-2-acetamido-3-amino-2,3-dideoxy-glucuronate N-acetyltransferase
MEMDKMPMKVAVVGSGYWGKNLVRNFHQLGALEYVCDEKQEALTDAKAKYGVKTTRDFDQILHDRNIDGVVIAVPAAQHYEMVKKCLMHEKDVFVEKPLALHAAEGKELAKIARERKRILMVGHILQYHPAMLELKRLIQEGELGKIQYIYSSRLNLGKLRTVENILWSFAPHDISAILFLLGELPHRVSSHGGTYLNSHIFDTTLTTCDFKGGIKAHIFVSWLHPFKEQKFAVVGDKKMAVFDDMEKNRKLVLYTHRIDWVDRMPVAHKDNGFVVPVADEEPLRRECEHFLECMQSRNVARTDGQSAVQVLEVLEACEQSLKVNGTPVELADTPIRVPAYYSHPTAVIDDDCEIGRGTKIWHFSHVMPGSSLGANCNVGQNVVISAGVRIGSNVKIQNNVSVYTGVELEDDVFCGPSMVFTNVINPRSHIVRKNEYKRTLIKKGASIGANATIVCGITLGRYSFVGAGSVVTRDVPDYALVLGVPAVQVGWVCYCGVRLTPAGSDAECCACGRHYTIENGACTESISESAADVPVALAR